MEKLIINSFKYGLDSRRTELTSNPGTLETAENGIIDAGGVFRKRMAFVAFSNLAILDGLGDQGTFGLQDTDTGPMTFGSALAHGVASTQNQPVLAAVMPVTTPQVVYQQLQHPEVVDGLNYNRAYHLMTRVVSSKNYQGKAFVAAKFADGNTFLYYNGTLIDSSRNGLVLPNSTSLALLGSDLARQIGDLADWGVTANKNGIPYSGSSTPVPLITITGNGSGATATPTINGNGQITGLNFDNRGVGYAEGDLFLVTDTTGLGALLRVFSTTSGAIQFISLISVGPVTLNGVDVVSSPAGSDFTPVPTATSTAGTLGFQFGDQDVLGVAAKAASVAFTLTSFPANGTIGITAFSDKAGTLPVTLCPVTGQGGTIQLAATAIVNAINQGTIFHGYMASLFMDSAGSNIIITITAPVSFGNATFNLTINVTNSVTFAATNPVGPFTTVITPAKPTTKITSKKKTTVSVVVNASSLNSFGTVTFVWAELANPGKIKMSATKGPTVTFSVPLVAGDFAIGSFSCTATDSLTNYASTVAFPVSLFNVLDTTK